MSSDTNKRPKEKAVSTNQAQKKKLEQSEAETRVIEKEPSSGLFLSTAAQKKKSLPEPEKKSAIEGQGNLIGLYVYALLKKFSDYKISRTNIYESILQIIENPDDDIEGDGYKNSRKTVERTCDALSEIFEKQSIGAKLVNAECGGMIKREKKKNINYYYFSDPQSPEHEYEVNQKDVKDKVMGGLWELASELY